MRHIVLVLPDADGLGVDFDELGQGVLQAARNGHRAAQVDVELGELLGRQLAGGVDRGPGLADDHVLQAQAVFGRQLMDDGGGELLGLMAGGAVADGQHLDAVRQDHLLDGALGLVDALELRHGVDDAGVQHFAGGVDDGDLAAHAVAGVQPHDRFAADGRLQQQLAQVVAKDADGPLGRSVGQLAAQLVFEAGVDQAAVGIQRGGFHQGGAGPAGLFAGKHPGDDGARALGVDLDADFEVALSLATVQRQHAVAGDLGQRLGIVVILGVDAVLVPGFGAGDAPERAVVAAQLGAAGRVVGDLLGQDVLRAGQRGVRVGHFVV